MDWILYKKLSLGKNHSRFWKTIAHFWTTQSKTLYYGQHPGDTYQTRFKPKIIFFLSCSRWRSNYFKRERLWSWRWIKSGRSHQNDKNGIQFWRGYKILLHRCENRQIYRHHKILTKNTKHASIPFSKALVSFYCWSNYCHFFLFWKSTFTFGYFVFHLDSKQSFYYSQNLEKLSFSMGFGNIYNVLFFISRYYLCWTQ